MAKPKYKYRYRSTQTGKWVKKEFALAHPDVCVKERAGLLK